MMLQLEEEMYTNKVIENFNAGILELDSNDEKGVTTLRSYLSKKLGCDPMRITKKYTGSACLGKKVYHADNFKGFNRIEIDNAAKELNMLEYRFRSKLDEIHRRKTSGLYAVLERSHVSTPSIDALIRNSSPKHYVGDKRKAENVGNISVQEEEELRDYFIQHPHLWNLNNQNSSSFNSSSNSDVNGIISNILSHVSDDGLQNIEDLIEAYKSRPELRTSNEFPISPQDNFRSEEYRDAILPSASSGFSISLATEAPSFLSEHSAATNFHVNDSCSSSSNNNNRFNSKSMNMGMSSSGIIGSSSTLAIGNSTSRKSEYDNYASSDYCEGEEGDRYMYLKSSSINKFEGAESNSNNGSNNVIDSNLLALESDQNAAADSLIGFINHIHREQSRSHDDLVDYVESVQRRSRSYNDLASMAQYSNNKTIASSSHHLTYCSQESKRNDDYGHGSYMDTSPRKSRSHNDLFDLIEKIVGCSDDNNDGDANDREDRSTELSIRTVLSDS